MTDIQSVVFYLFWFILSSLMVHVGTKRKFWFLTLIGLMIPIFIAGLRFSVGTDYATYVSNIAWLEGVSVQSYISDFSSYLEPTFYIFTQVAYFFNYPQLVFFIYSAISILFMHKALKTSGVKHIGLAYFLFLAIMFPMSFNLVRQFAAIALAVYATVLLFNGHKKRYYLYTILASLLHVSAIVNIIALIVYARTKNKNKRSISTYKFILGVVMLFFVSALALYGLQKYGYLFEMDATTSNLNFVPRLIMLLVVLTLMRSSSETYSKYKLFISLGVLCVMLGMSGFLISYGDRIALYFLPFIMMLFPTSVYYLMPKKKKYLTVPVVVIVGVLYFIASYYVLGSHDVLPYAVESR